MINLGQGHLLTLAGLLSIHTFQRSFSLKPLGQSNQILYEASIKGTNVYINNTGHMTKMAAMLIYGKNHSKIFFSITGELISTKLCMKYG